MKGKTMTWRIRFCTAGVILLITFLCMTTIASLIFILGIIHTIQASGNLTIWTWIVYAVVAFMILFVMFWTGIIMIYTASIQLGIRWRILGALCGMIPIVHLVVLILLIRIVIAEIKYEKAQLLRNEERHQDQICKTKYPVLMVHGVFFRDYKYLNYWGRIPEELEYNGATIYYGRQESACTVEESAEQLAVTIQGIIEQTGAEKVNVIAHSKGGLDMRMALTRPEIARHVASLTTINTPHRGCEFADYLLHVIPEKEQQAIASAYNAALKKFGDQQPDFLGAVSNLTHSYCESFNQRVQDAPEVYYASVGSKLNRAGGGRFPLNFSYRLAKSFDGDNDGLVGEASFAWGEKFTYLTTKEKRGISHGDMIDLNRENIADFNVREFYIQLVSGLREKGF